MSHDKDKLLAELKETNAFQSWRIKEQQETIWKLQDEALFLKDEIDRLNAIIISGGAVVPDAKPYEEPRQP